MADYDKDEFKFPDEVEMDQGGEVEDKLEIEIEDDTPEQDRGREPMPKNIVDELEQDELEEYSDSVKVKFKQMKKVWHDERRAKEAAYREQQEAVDFARKVAEENKRLKAQYSTGEQHFMATAQHSAALEVNVAKQAYKDAYDSGDSDALVEAQESLNNASFKLNQLKNYQPSAVQNQENEVQQHQERQPVNQPDRRAMAWQERNSWFGQDEEMTAAALGLHEKLKRNGIVVGSDDYYATLDKTMRKRFSENFDEPETRTPRTKSGTVVASAARSTSPNKVRLKASQIQLAKKLGLTPEQYAREAIKLEAQ
tara:strand:+ start:544 stop:1476 length:933 start_codon:yes stop_codon:yes gene_type:complete